ncbi:ankyrin repeat domain-containing protein [Streptomyces sp. NPDC001858]
MSLAELQDYAAIRRRLDEGADPESWSEFGGSPLYVAARSGSPEVVAELARRVSDVDALDHGTNALWAAVLNHRPDNARALVAAGADAWRPQIADWSPGRLSLAGPTPDMFTLPKGQPGLTPREQAEVEEAVRLRAALGKFTYEGTGLAFVAGLDADEATRRLEAAPARAEDYEGVDDFDTFCDFDDLLGNIDDDYDKVHHLIGVTNVPGGCVVAQPWGFTPSVPEAVTRLSAGTVCYGLYANPGAGDQGSITRNMVSEGWDLRPGQEAGPEATSREVLLAYLYPGDAIAYACAYVGLRLTDAGAVCSPDRWVQLTEGDHWQ